MRTTNFWRSAELLRVREKKVADEAVYPEPVSAPDSLIRGKNTGKFASSSPFVPTKSCFSRAKSVAYTLIPCVWEQGIFRPPSGMPAKRLRCRERIVTE